MRAYVSGPLTGAVDLAAARALYVRVGNACSRVGFDPYVPHLFNDPQQHAHLSAREVYDGDLQALLASGIVVGYVGAPSLGAGAELALALQASIPVLAFHYAADRVSRFILGMLEVHGATVLRLTDAELELDLEAALSKMLPAGL